MTKPNAGKWILPAGLAVSLAFMGACGGSSDPGSQTSSTATTVAADSAESTESDTANPMSEEAATTVEIVEFAYSPKQITVAVGDTVKWVNRDEFLHTVTSGAVDGPENKPDGKFEENLDEAGSEVTVTFDEAGTFTYFCSQHNAMDGLVTVE